MWALARLLTTQLHAPAPNKLLLYLLSPASGHKLLLPSSPQVLALNSKGRAASRGPGMP